jgi:integral membrane protein (TIGR01906 family)
VFGLVALAVAWSGDWAYTALATATGHTNGTLLLTSPIDGRRTETNVGLDVMVSWHHLWASYVTGVSPREPISWGGPMFTSDEYAHMADVRTVFRGAETLAVLGLGVIVFRLIRARGQGTALRLVRDASLVATAVVVIVGIAAALAFDPLFLLFHEIFFPQGNFLFDPATSNLLRLYPEWYWQGVTAGVGVSFIGLALIAAAAATVALRRASTYTRAA